MDLYEQLCGKPVCLVVVAEAKCGQSRVVSRLTQSVDAHSGAPVVTKMIDGFPPSREPGLWVGQHDVQSPPSASLAGVDHQDWNTEVGRVPDGPPPRRRSVLAAER